MTTVRRTSPPETRHATPFSRLPVPFLDDAPLAFYEKWVVELFSTSLWYDCDALVRTLRPLRDDVDEAVARQLLSLFDYRARFVGASLAALRLFTDLEMHIGRLLLRSDFPFSGRAFCVALVRLNSPTAIGVLTEYLDYYLTRPDLDFDQAFAMAALGHIDRRNGTSLREPFIPRWKTFVGESPFDALASQERFLASTLRAIETAAEDGA